MAQNQTAVPPTEAFNSLKSIRSIACVIAAQAPDIGDRLYASSSKTITPQGSVNLTAGNWLTRDTVHAAIRTDKDGADVSIGVTNHDFSFLDPNLSRDASVNFRIDKDGKAGPIDPDQIQTSYSHSSGTTAYPNIAAKTAQDIAQAKELATKVTDAINTGSCEAPARKFKGYNPP